MTDPQGSPAPIRPYADAVADYALAGWPCILPVPPATKTPPPVGFTGAGGRDTDHLTLVAFASEYPAHSIALRMPEIAVSGPNGEMVWGVIGIDVDAYEKAGKAKYGAETLAHYLALWGPLPPTWTSTARDAAGPSRIHFYRVPAQRYATRLQATHPDGRVTGDIEIIQRHHRYAVVWPSVHEQIGGTYTWYDPTGTACPPPKPLELPELPAAWVAGLAEGASAAGPPAADVGSGGNMLDQLLSDWRPECAEITNARQIAEHELAQADAGSRHDTMTARIHHLVQIGAAGHTGVAWAINELRAAWAELTAGEAREEEFERMLLTSARKAVSAVGLTQVPRDPCLLTYAVAVPGPMPGDDGTGVEDEGGPAEPVEPARWWSVREVIGAHAFDPVADLDQPLAERVLERVYPTLRYAYDSGGWLLRAPRMWELHKDLSGWAVAQVAPLMPVGDPTADKESEAFARSKRRARLMTSGGAGAIAKKIDHLVAGGMHPASVKLGDLDADPEILWAGGLPWSLRASRDALELAAVDPATPHLHSAGVTPDLRPTPLWDVLLEAVFPDPELRAWAVRVLAITLTGYADRALPILYGETGRGKTQVIALLMSVLGSYAHAADPRLMTPGGENAHASIVFALKGRRLSFIDEGPREGRVAQERLKQLTGGGELTANQMNQNPITFRPTHTLVLTTNDEPPLVDPAIRARARIIPCDGDPELVRRARAAIGHIGAAAWRAEAPGVLGRMILEAAGWIHDPSTAAVTAAPENVRYLAEHIGAEQDPVTVWLSEECEPFEAGSPSRELYQAFTASCVRSNMRKDAIPSETKWGKTLTRMGFPPVRSERHNLRRLRVRPTGFLPGMAPPAIGPAEDTPSEPWRVGPNPGGFMEGSSPNPPGEFSQVNQRENTKPGGSGGFEQFFTHARPSAPAPAHAHESRPGEPSNPPFETAPSSENAALTCENAESGVDTNPPGPEKPKRTRAQTPEQKAAAQEKAAATREAKRQAALAEAGGPTVPLPALLTRDGAVRSVTAADADALLATITARAGELTVDVENTGFPVGHEHYALRTVQLGNEHFALVLDPEDAEQRDVVRRHLAAAAVLHAHSATADLVPLEVAGLLEHGLEEAWSRMVDTVLLAKLADPASTGSDPGLKQLAEAVLRDAAISPTADEARTALFKAGKWLTNTKATTPIERSGWAQVDPCSETMIRYAASDVLDDAAIARALPRPPDRVLERERMAQRMTARVAFHGLRLDGEQVAHLRGEQQAALSEATQRLAAFGIDNPGSDQQVGAAVERLGVTLPRTPTGRPSVASGVLEPYAAAEGDLGELVRARLAYQEAENRLGLFLDGYQLAVQHGDGRVRPTVYTMEAKTGRMSCVRPNLQQVPRSGGYRSCITADPGHVLISADFSSVELRVAAALSQDEAMLRMLAEGVDYHQMISRIVWGPDAGKAERYKAKPMVFGRIYGSGPAGMAKQNGVSEAIARAVIDAMDHLTPGLTEWSRMVADGINAGRTQFVTHSGRVVHMPIDRAYAGPNYCIQGTARELLIDALERWQTTRWGTAVLLPVHDELVIHVPEDDAQEATGALVECMTSELAGVPIVAEASEPSFAWQDSV